eukprot:SAG31_NODE_5576_length_2447_cov_2.667376_2_plen_63_part_00
MYDGDLLSKSKLRSLSFNLNLDANLSCLTRSNGQKVIQNYDLLCASVLAGIVLAARSKELYL